MRAATFCVKVLVGCAALSAAAQPAQAGWLDSLLGKSSVPAEAASGDPGQRIWRIREFAWVLGSRRSNACMKRE